MEEKKITKIVINKEDELTDIVSAILDSRNERIVLTFAEETDLLISPINLKVLLETADENEKLLVAQIIKNPTGLRNANLAGLSSIDTPSFPVNDTWIKEEVNRARRLNPPREKVVEEKKVVEEEPVQVSDFQKRVDETIERNKENILRKEMEKEDVFLALDEDLPIEQVDDFPESDPEIVPQPDLSKMDFNKKTAKPLPTQPEQRVKERRTSSINFKKISQGISGIFNKIPMPTKLKKLTPIIALSVVLLTILIGFIYINTAMLVKVKIYVEAKEVSVEKIFQGDENIKEVNFEELKIPTKKEEIEKARSSNIKATGKAFKGEKAKGKVNITYIKEGCNAEVEPLSLPAGTTLSTGGKTYTLDAALTIKCNTPTESSITAIEVGEEYNISQGQLFLVQGYSSNQLLVLNNSSAITGGSKEEYTVLSKSDVDTAVEELSKVAIEESESELKSKAGTWEIITDSIKSEVVADSIKTEVAIGSQASEVNLSIKVKSIASYYLKEGFDEGVEGLLTQEAKDNNLFETDKDWDLELDQDIEKNVTVVENNAQGIKIKLEAKSAVKPKVNKEDIVEALKEMDWEEGQEYLKSLEFSEKETRVEFLPEKFPEWLKQFPKRRGGVLITVVNVN